MSTPSSSTVQNSVQGSLGEDEALAKAIHLSLQEQESAGASGGADGNRGDISSRTRQEEEERQLREAIERSKRDLLGNKEKCAVQ